MPRLEHEDLVPDAVAQVIGISEGCSESSVSAQSVQSQDLGCDMFGSS